MVCDIKCRYVFCAVVVKKLISDYLPFVSSDVTVTADVISLWAWITVTVEHSV